MKVLIVVDMQNDFIDGVLGTRELNALWQELVVHWVFFHARKICQMR